MIETRPLSPNDKVLLKAYAGTPWRHALPFAFGFTVLWAIAAAVLYGFWLWIAPHAGIAGPHGYRHHVVAAAGLAAALFVGHGFAKFMRRALAVLRDPAGLASRARRDLAGGVATVETLSVRAAIEIKPFEDEGTGFFLELADGRVLCVIGQDLDRYARDAVREPADGADNAHGAFPSTRIDYVTAPASGLRLDIHATGEPLRPRGMVATTARHFKSKGPPLPEDGGYHQGPLDAVVKRFGYVERPLPQACTR